MQRFINKAKHTITFHTANGPTVPENVANIHVKEVDEDITPYILNNAPPVLTVGYRCMEMRYTFMWPGGQSPFLIRPDGMIIHLVVEHYIPYLVPGEKRCKPQRPTGSMTFCRVAPAPSSNLQSDVSGGTALSTRPKSRVNKSHRVDKVVLSDDEPAIVEDAEDTPVGGGEGQSALDDEFVDHVPPAAIEIFARGGAQPLSSSYSQSQITHTVRRVGGQR